MHPEDQSTSSDHIWVIIGLDWKANEEMDGHWMKS
jgi:hypothetical protein